MGSADCALLSDIPPLFLHRSAGSFCKQSCGVVSVSTVGKDRHDHFALVFGTLCQFDCAVQGCAGGNAD